MCASYDATAVPVGPSPPGGSSNARPREPLLTLDLIQDKFRYRPSNATEDRCGKGAHHSAYGAGYKLDDAFHEFRHHAIAGTLPFRGFVLQCLNLLCCLLLHFVRRGANGFGQRAEDLVELCLGNFRPNDFVPPDDVSSHCDTPTADVDSAALSSGLLIVTHFGLLPDCGPNLRSSSE